MPGFFASPPPHRPRWLTAAWAVLFFAVVFGLVPWYAAVVSDRLGWPRGTSPVTQAIGGGVVVGALALMLHCSRLFARVGKGTPVPFDPPTELVTSGVYGVSRNPIYVGQVAILLGYFLCFGQLGLLLHAVVWALLVQGWIVWVEEPGLRLRFGTEYVLYTQQVPRWIGMPQRRAPRT